MEFNITRLDKVLLIQALYIHATPKGYGEIEYEEMLEKGKAVECIPDYECRKILHRDPHADYYVVDYYNGKPLKLHFTTQENNDTILVNSFAYDSIHGKYRFLEALLSVFNLEEIRITQTSYPSDLHSYLPPNEKSDLFKGLLKKMVRHKTDAGSYWYFDTTKCSYRSPLLDGSGI